MNTCKSSEGVLGSSPGARAVRPFAQYSKTSVRMSNIGSMK
jgi:hypothetical protein